MIPYWNGVLLVGVCFSRKYFKFEFCKSSSRFFFSKIQSSSSCCVVRFSFKRFSFKLFSFKLFSNQFFSWASAENRIKSGLWIGSDFDPVSIGLLLFLVTGSIQFWVKRSPWALSQSLASCLFGGTLDLTETKKTRFFYLTILFVLHVEFSNEGDLPPGIGA